MKRIAARVSPSVPAFLVIDFTDRFSHFLFVLYIFIIYLIALDGEKNSHTIVLYTCGKNMSFKQGLLKRNRNLQLVCLQGQI